MKPHIIVPILLAFALCAPQLASAKSSRPKPSPHHTVIESVTSDGITVTTTNGGSTVSFKVNAETEITYDGQDIPLSQLQPGMRVDVTADAADSGLASVIIANGAPPADATPTPKKK